MSALAFCIPGDLHLPTGGYRYDREVLARLPACGIAAGHISLGPGFPHPSADHISHAMEAMAAVDPQTTLLIDGLALGALPPAEVEALPHDIVALVHHPLGLEAGMTSDRAIALLANERAVLAVVRHIIVTSATTARILRQDFGVAEQCITVAEPGTARQPRATGTGKPFHVLAVGAVSARKAYDRLVAALAPLAQIDWRLTIAGSLSLSPDATARLRETIEASGHAGRVTLTGAVGEAQMAALFSRADVFAMSSLFEGYGMALAEALAYGLPIVTSSGGAAGDTVPDAAAIKVTPGDTAGLTAALRRVMTDAALRARMADSAWAAAATLPTWDDTARTIAKVVSAP